MAMEKIESNENLLMSILVRVPPKSVFRFRCVSKRWNDIVVDPFFIRSYEATKREECRISSKSGNMKNLMQFIQTKTYITLCSQWLYYRKDDLCSDITWRFRNKIYGLSSINDDDRSINVPRKFGFLLHSNNGLILCGRYRTDTYHVLNPFVRTCVSLPPPPELMILDDDDDDYGGEIITSIGLVCKEEENSKKSNHNLEPNFKVVKAQYPPYGMASKYLQIQTYSSKTRDWTRSTLVGTERFSIHICNSAVSVFNGVLHWFTMDRGLAVYDSSNECDNHVQLIALPLQCHRSEFDGFNVTRDDDNVLWCCVNNNSREKWLQLWMLPKDGKGGGGYRRSTTIHKEEWILMHTITHVTLRKDIMNTRYAEYLFIQLLWLFPMKAAVFIVDGMHTCIYSFETNSVESCFPIGHEFGIDSISLYMEPLSLSSYALSPKAYDN